MGKWFAIATAALLVVLAVLWRQLQPAPLGATEPTVAAPTPTLALTPPTQVAAIQAQPVAEPAPAPESDKPKKIDVESDAFYTRFLDVVPAKLSSAAAKCYDGIPKRVTRNQELSVKYKLKIKNGEVTISDVTVVKDTLNNPALANCFIQQMQRSVWHNDELPDWEGEDELALSPERGMKKYMRDNIEYVGDPAPKG